MLSYLLKATLCWALFYLLYRFWLGKLTFFKVNRWYLLGTALAGLLLPLADLSFWWPLGQGEILFVQYLQPVGVGAGQLEAVLVTASTNDKGFNWWGLLTGVYWTGAALALGRFFTGLFKIKKLYHGGEQASSNGGYQLVLTDAAHPPFSFFKNLFWSRHFTVDEDDKQTIVRHEEAHIFQWHSLDVVFLEILGVVFWCCPFIHFYKQAIKTTHEYLADEYVVAQTGRKKYSQLLLRQSQPGMPVAFCNSFFSSQLKNRIVMMTKNKSSKMASLKYLAALPLFALLLTAFSFSGKAKQAATDLHEQAFPSLAVADTLPGDEIFKMVEETPVFAGCAEMTNPDERKKCSDEEMFQFIFGHLKYPEEARNNKVEGMVVASFVIETDGSVSGAKIVRSIGSGCDEETLRVINNMPNWTPGKQQGKAVRVQYNLPIRFKLSDEDAAAKTDQPEKAPTDPEEIFKVVEQSPMFPGCNDATDQAQQKKCADEKMLGFIYGNIKYPVEAKTNGIQGIVVASFIIEKDGSITNVKCVRDIGGGCGEEVVRVISRMPKWVPGQQGGKPVRVQFNLPVKFKLDDDEKTVANVTEPPTVGLKAFPNPATDKVSLEIFGLTTGRYKATLTDQNGRQVESRDFEVKDGKATTILVDLPVKKVARGILYVTLTNDKGQTVITSSVILQ